MPKKLQFQVVHVSGYDNDHGPKELEIHSPVTKGWQSQRFCVYPQEVVLRLAEPSCLKKLQILSHQYLVASKIEIFAGMVPDSKAPSLLNCKFNRLGYISLSDNESTNYKTRELKSVNLNVVCHFVKFVIHKNYVNMHNLYNQVNIIALNLIGDPLDEISTESKRIDMETGGVEELVEHFLAGGNTAELKRDVLKGNRPDYISPLDDLAFDIYQDSETAQLIRRLDAKKQDAVLEERFDYAKKLKQAIADLQKVGEKLGKFEVEKRRAVEIEDYDLAKAKKLQADEYRLHVYKQLDLPDLLEMKMEKPMKQHRKEVGNARLQSQQVKSEAISSRTLPPVQAESRSPRPALPDSPVLPPIVSSNTVTQTYTAEQKVQRTPEPGPEPRKRSPTPQPSDDRPIKGTTQMEENIALAMKEDVTTNVEADQPAALSEKDESEASPIIDVYGMHLVQLAYSKIWKHRQEAMETVYSELTTDPSKLTFESEPKAIARATALLLNRILSDNVFTVFSEAVKVERYLLTEYIPLKKLGKSELGFAIDKTIPVLMTRCGDMAARTNETAITAIFDIALLKDVKALGTVPGILVQPIKSKKQAPWRLFKGRLDVIHKLLDPLDVDKPGSFTTDGVMQMVKKAIEHSHNDVREGGIELLYAMYKKVGNSVRKYLPPDDATSRKNALYNRIFDGLDKIDGKPTKAEQKLQAKQDKENIEKAKKDEIAALQAQLTALRAVTNDSDKTKPESNADVSELKDSQAQDAGNLEKICIFCGEQNETFDAENLDVHYWKSCPMLKRCSHCSQVIEICNLNEHLLTECDKKAEFKKCPRCQEAILKVEFDTHLKAKSCPATRGGKSFNRCPLCKEKVSSGEEAWKKHLTHDCKANTKRLQQQKQGPSSDEKQVSTKKSRTTNTGAVVKRRTTKHSDQSIKKS